MDLIDSAEKRSTEELLNTYYDRALKYVLDQNKKLSKLALDTNVAGGYVETYYARGIMRKDFSTPLAQTLTAEEMANDGYFAQILNLFCALCSEVKTELSYKSATLINDPFHKKIYDFINIQLDNIGGYETVFERVIKPSLRWGTGIGQTVMRPFKFQGQTLAGLESLKTVNLMNVMQFVFDEDDPSQLDSLRYLTFPKMINTELSSGIEEEERGYNNDIDNSNTTEVTVKTLSIKNNCAAVTAHNAIDGNPLGLPYLYFLYPVWKTYKAMLEGTYNAMVSFGTYPVAVKRNSNESGVDPLAWENAESDKLQEIISLGGAPYISSEGEMYKLDPPDVEKLLTAQQSIYDIATRASGLGQITMGIQGGGSRDLMESIDVLTDKHIKSTIKSALIDVSNTLIKNLVRINFAREWTTGRIVDTPALRLKAVDENDIMSNRLQVDNKTISSGFSSPASTSSPKPAAAVPAPATQSKKEKIEKIKEKTLIEKITQSIKTATGSIIEKVKQAMTINTYATGNNTQFEILVSKPTGVVSEILLDLPGLDNMLIDNRNMLASVLEKRLVPAMKDLVKKTVDSPLTNINLWSVLDKETFKKEVTEVLQALVLDSAREQTRLIENGLRLGNQKWEEAFKNVSMEEFTQKSFNKYVKSEAFKDIVATTVADAQNSVFSYLTNINKSFIAGSKEQKQRTIARIENQIDELKGLTYKNMAEDATVKTFNNVGDYELKEVGSSLGEKYVMIRHTAAENKKNICSVCYAKEGKIYYWDEYAEEYISRDGEAAEFPDPECKGVLGGHTCRCGGVLVPVAYTE